MVLSHQTGVRFPVPLKDVDVGQQVVEKGFAVPLIYKDKTLVSVSPCDYKALWRIRTGSTSETMSIFNTSSRWMQRRQ